MEQDTTPSGTRTCAYCGTPLRPDARSDQQYCGRTHKRQARRVEKREAERHARRVDKYPPLADMRDGAEDRRDDLDEDHADRRTAEQVEQDERIHQILGIETEAAPRRQVMSEAWRRWREFGNRHGTEHPEQTAGRIARQRAAYDASVSRTDSYTAGRVQDRHDPRTAGNPGRNAAASRRLNAAHVEQPPSWTAEEFDFDLRPGESWTGGPFRAGRSESGQRSRSADARWDLGIGEHFRY